MKVIFQYITISNVFIMTYVTFFHTDITFRHNVPRSKYKWCRKVKKSSVVIVYLRKYEQSTKSFCQVSILFANIFVALSTYQCFGVKNVLVFWILWGEKWEWRDGSSKLSSNLGKLIVIDMNNSNHIT